MIQPKKRRSRIKKKTIRLVTIKVADQVVFSSRYYNNKTLRGVKRDAFNEWFAEQNITIKVKEDKEKHGN